MPKFAANLSMMFNEVPFLDRFSAAAAAGLRAVEYLFPYEYPAEEIGKRLREHQLENVVFNLPPGDWAAGERGTACIPGREGEFRAGVEKALTYAISLEVSRLHAMAGLASAKADPAALKATYIANLRYAAEKFAPHGITLLIEAINTRDMPGFYLNTQAHSFTACSAVNLPNYQDAARLLSHADHGRRPRDQIAEVCPVRGHMQVASVPKRNAPDSGEVNYPYLFRVIDEIGYDGWVGCEYRPAGKTSDGLTWLLAASGSVR